MKAKFRIRIRITAGLLFILVTYLSGPLSRGQFLVLRGAGLDKFSDDKPKCM
jgi:hypothetical protein